MYRKFCGFCKRALASVLLIVTLCLLGGCSAEEKNVEIESTTSPADSSIVGGAENENQYSQVSNEQPQDSADGNEKQPDSVSAGERYREILLNNGKFLSADLNNKELSLADIREAVTDDDNITVSASKFTVVDLDADGENEIVLWLQTNSVSDYGFEILREKDETIYGYTLPYRAFMDLKTDGTFEFSGGAADTGIGKLEFSEEGYTTEKLVYSDSEYDAANELTVQYFAYGEACSEEEFNAAMSQQEAKPGVDWYELTESGVDAAFENRF